MKVLGWDTATAATAVALLDTAPGRTWEERHDPADGARPGHAAELLPGLERVLQAAGLAWSDVERLVVGVGPGSFTGLRIGLATGRALALALGVPLSGASTLRALAARAEHEPEYTPELVLAVLDARRGEVFAAAWRAGSELLMAPAALAPPALAERVAALPGRPVALGDGAVRFRAELEAAGAAIPDDGSPLHRVSARHTCQLGAGPEASPPEPEYLRAPDARPSR